ncbi:MAG: glycosyltransferase family 9 protein [Candidatus Coatesbacteria bacterium]|nr:MAG: glycosyltransferase family 9 protein [Candidatus Coatesbacteria bacterium]
MAKRKNIFKRAYRAVARAAARVILQPRAAPLPPPEAIRKIVIVKMWAIGEYVMATPAFAALRELYRDAHLTLLTGVALSPLASSAPFFDDVLTVPEGIFVRPRPGKLRRLRRRLAEESFDLAVVFHHAWEFSAFVAWTKIPHCLGFDRNGDGFAHTVKVPLPPEAHQVEEYFELARACGAAGEPGPLLVTPGAEAQAEAAHFLTQPPFDGRPVIVVAPGGGINPKTRMEIKRWPEEHYRELCTRLKADFDLLVVGGPSEGEANARLAAAVGAWDLTGKTSLGALYLLLQRAAAFVGNDSAPMHLAAAAGVPTVAFFGPTDPKLNGPWKTPALVLSREIECAPCYKDGYFPRCDHRRCLAEIAPAEAATRLYDFLDSQTG